MGKFGREPRRLEQSYIEAVDEIDDLEKLIALKEWAIGEYERVVEVLERAESPIAIEYHVGRRAAFAQAVGLVQMKIERQIG